MTDGQVACPPNALGEAEVVARVRWHGGGRTGSGYRPNTRMQSERLRGRLMRRPLGALRLPISSDFTVTQSK